MCLLDRMVTALESIAHSLERLADAGLGPEVVGIVLTPGEPVMAKPKVKFEKASKGASARAPATRAKAGDPVQDFVLLDTQNDTITVQGTNSAGDVLDISAVATIAVSSSDTSALTVDPPQGMVFQCHALKVTPPGSPVLVTAVATWNDGSVGPFTMSLPIDVQTGGPTGLILVPGTPTIR